MNRPRRIAVLSALAEKLLLKGSWCGETHLQKATYFLQELIGVPTDFEFILYKHGPFSFDLRDELMAMRAEGFFKLHVREERYGPSMLPTERSKHLRDKYPKTLGQFEKQIDFVAERLGAKNAAKLEQLATGLYATLKQPEELPETLAKWIAEMKPHVSFDEAMVAVEDVKQIKQEWASQAA